MQPQDPNNTQPTTPPTEPQMPVTPTQPPKNNKNALIIVAAIVIIAALGVMIFTMLNANKDTNSNAQPSTSNTNNSTSNNPSSDKFQKFNMNDKLTGKTYSVYFYKDAKVEEKNGRTYLNSGAAGSMYSVYLGVATGDAIDCGSASKTTMNLSGGSTTVCYDSDNMQYAGYAKAKNDLVKINLAGQKAISMDDAKTIMESVSFN